MQHHRLRVDAQRSRDAIIAAYSALADQRGADVPLYEVARHAGVGQGTLYRHFPDRIALLAALFESRLDELEHVASAGAGRPTLVFELLDLATQGQAALHRLSSTLIAAEDSRAELQHLSDRNAALFTVPLEDAIAAGLIRPEVTTTDLVAVQSMMEGMLIGLTSAAEREAAIERGMRIALRGIRRSPDAQET